MHEIKNKTFRLIKCFPTSTGKLKYGFECGFSNSKYNRSAFYGLDKKYTMPGLSLKAKVNFPLVEVTGMELALISNINKYHSFIGCEFQLNLGYISNTAKARWPTEN